MFPSFGRKSSFAKISTTTEVLKEAFAVSFIAVGMVGLGSVLSGFPSPSESGFNGFVLFASSVPFVTPSPSQSNAAQVVFAELGAILYEHELCGSVLFANSVALLSPSPSQSALFQAVEVVKVWLAAV